MSDERFGRYRLVRRIGAGGMAEVFRAELVGAEGVTRELVVKKVHPRLSLDPEAVAMFVEEARVAARLHHPNVVQVYEFGRAGDGYFLAMELVDGCDLAALLRGERLPDGALAWAFSELLAGLGYVHALRDPAGRPLGLVHRDVSPHNVLVGAAGEVKLADFGIATVSARVAPDGSVKGKYAYMAPEQARGEPVDARADLFAVGAMLYESLAGRRMHPAGADDGRVPDAVRAGRVDPIAAVAPGVHAALAAVVTRAVAPDARDRYADARSFRDALTAAFAEAGARPDREALQGLVHRRLEGARGAATPAADRTLTAQGDPLGGDASAANDLGHEAPDGTMDKPSERLLDGVRSPSRRLVERVGIAIGVATLAVLTERKTRPAPPTAAVVRVALPDEPGVLRWFAGAPRAAAERACRCRVEARAWRSAAELAGWMRSGEADLAAVTSTVFPALAGAGLVASGVGDGVALRPEVARAAVHAGLMEGGRMVPAAVDVVVLAWRADAARDVAARVTAQRAALDGALVAQAGVGLPARFAYERDPGYWTWWDLLAAGHAWRAVDGVARVGVSDALPAWGARVAAAGAAEVGSIRTGAYDREAWVEALGWEAALASLGVAAPFDGSPPNDRAGGGYNAVVAPARALVGRGARWELGAVPRGDAGLLDATADGRRFGGSVRVGEVLGWVTAARAAGGFAARRALAALSVPARRDALAWAWRALPARADGALPDDPALRGELAQEESVLRGGPFALAWAGLTLAEVTRASQTLGALRRQARTGEPAAFVGGGRWRASTIRAAVSEAFEVRADGGL